MLKKCEGIAILLFCSSALLSADKPALKPSDLLVIRQVNSIHLSSDGKSVAFVVTEPTAKQTRVRRTTLWTVSTAGKLPPVRVKTDLRSISAPAWSPDGQYLGFVARPSASTAGNKQLFLLRTKNQIIEQVTNVAGDIEKFVWSPDSRFIAFSAKRQTKTAPDTLPTNGFEADQHPPLTSLWSVEVVNRKAVKISQARLEVSDFCWAPDSNQLAVRVSDSSLLDDKFWHSRLVIIQRSSGEVVRTISEVVSPWEGTLEWSPDGETIAFPEFTPRKIAAQLTLRSLTGEHQRVATGYSGTIRVEKWAPNSKYLIAQAALGTKAAIVQIDVTSGQVTELVTASANASPSGFSISSNGHTIAYLCGKPDAPADVCVFEVGGDTRTLTNLHSYLADFRIGSAREISWKSRHDGQVVYGALYLPPDFIRDQSYPTVVLVHGGPLQAWTTGWNNWADLLASNGYAVLLPNPRGSEGNGWRFAEANFNDWGGGDFEDIMDGVDQLISGKIADPDRLGIAGRSYGGFMTAWAITQTGRFKAAVEGAGITNLLSFHAQASIAPTFLKIYFDGYPFEQWAAYQQHSPTYYLAKVKTPTLIMHGLDDDVVPASQSWELYRGLKMAGTETKLILYPREPHVLTSPNNQIDEMTRMLAWFDQHLKQAGGKLTRGQ